MTSHTCVESFNIRLEPFSDVLQAENPTTHVERLLLGQLECPVRLLRWAIVQVEEPKTLEPDGQQAYWCEGAYLKSI